MWEKKKRSLFILKIYIIFQLILYFIAYAIWRISYFNIFKKIKFAKKKLNYVLTLVWYAIW